MKTRNNSFRCFFAAVLLVLATTKIYASFSYTISFTASGTTTSVGSVQVQNLTHAGTVTVPSGNTLTLTDKPSAVEVIDDNNGGISISRNTSTGTSTLTFYAEQAGIAQVAAYAIDGRKVVGLATLFEAGDNSLELSLPAGMFLIHVWGIGYAYSAKLQSQTGAATQAGIKFLTHTDMETSTPQKSKVGAPTTTTMSYTTGDQLLYTATSGTYISSVSDVPTGSKITNFNFASIPTSTIPGGTFTMGSPLTEVGRSIDETQHTVTLSSYIMSKYEITNAQYAAFLNSKSIANNGIWALAPLYNIQTLIYVSSGSYDWGLHYNGLQWVPVAGYENAPVIYVTWFGASEYANYLGGKLPTEAQWEYACRAGTTTPFSTGNFLTNFQANYDWSVPYNGGTNTVTSSPGKTQTVGTYAANAFGLHDMNGNVAEWCSDWYDTYPVSAQTNPTGAAKGWYCVIRGGSWYGGAAYCRSAERANNHQDLHISTLGFRVAFAP